MDQIKTGKFIAELRRGAGLTQEALGERLGVTNKTVSRWETGRYMPDLQMLQLLALELQVSVDELLSGQRLSGESAPQRARGAVPAAAEESPFSLEERKAFFKKKWRREHIGLFVLLAGILAAFVLVPFALGRSYLAGLSPLVALVEYGYQNNKMMSYVESKLFD